MVLIGSVWISQNIPQHLLINKCLASKMKISTLHLRSYAPKADKQYVHYNTKLLALNLSSEVQSPNVS